MMRAGLLPEEAVKKPSFQLHAPHCDGFESTLHGQTDTQTHRLTD